MIAPGCGVAVIAPAGPVSDTAYRAGLALLAQRYRLVQAYAPDQAGGPADAPSYLAANDAARASWINAAIRDPAVSAIFCARGGYGCARIVEHLDSTTFARRRLPLVGFSDITVLHGWAAALGVPTIHGPVVTQLPRLPTHQLQGLFALLEQDQPSPLSGLRTIHGGAAHGPLWGGNLTIIPHLLGTPYLPRLRGHILLLEDVGEAPYRIDRMCTQLLQSGALSEIAGVVLGQFSDCDAAPGRSDRASPTTALEVLAERLSALGVPVAGDAPIGHGDDNVAMPLGRQAHLDANAGTLSF